MADSLPAGPYRTIHSPDGIDIPFYIIPFDKEGRCEGPETRAHLLASAPGFTDLFIFSHGWNNDWAAATRRYEHFIDGFTSMRQSLGLKAPDGYRPALVGIFWPSAVLVADDEEAPAIAAGGPDAVSDKAIAEERQSVSEIAARLRSGDVERFYVLAQRDDLSDAEALELANILAPIYAAGEDELSTAPPTAEAMVASWKAAAAEAVGAADQPDPEDFGTVRGGSAGPQAAGFFSGFRNIVRNAIRGTTVWMMKDRAGTVGAKGVGPLLVELLATSQARVHLIGHSYGAKVVLSAVCEPRELPRKVHSILLLQPAVSHLCFADNVPVRDVPGGYRAALDRVERPIFSTFSSHDIPLTQIFHLAVVRPADLGEMRIASAGEPPTWFAALGGYGPRRAGEQLVDIRLPPAAYNLDPDTRIYGLRGDSTISGHGDISNPSTWLALHMAIR